MKSITLIFLAFTSCALAFESNFDLSSLTSTLLNEPFIKGVTADTFVTIKNGTLRGVTSVSNNGRTIYNYRKIPFAKPPQGELRFQPPQPRTEGWGDEIWDATVVGPSCPQYLTALSAPASEDCLYLNVHTPRAPDDLENPLPVMLFMYGGGFAFGDSVLYEAKKMLANDVILVVPHYRIGALGFLSTGDEVIPGNNGLKDIVLSLRWVQENIDKFGGDPNKVTLFGESAGAAGSLATFLSPLSTGLFHRVIAMSGTPITDWAMDRTPWESAQRYAETLGCPTDTSRNLVDCLKGLDFKLLAQASFNKLIVDLSSLKLVFEATAPVVEPDLPGAFMTEDPLKLLEEGKFPDIPVMLGAVQHEGSAVLGAAYSLNWRDDESEDPEFIRDKLIPTLFNAIGVDELSRGGAPISQSMVMAYLPDSPRENFSEIGAGVTDMLSVLLFKAPILRTTELLAAKNLDKVFLYSFEYEGYNSLWTLAFNLLSTIVGAKAPPLKHGVMHADDLQYFFTIPFIIIGKDRQFSDMVCKIWADFATHGNPTPDPEGDWPQWPSYSSEFGKENYYQLVLPPVVKSNYMKNWRQGV